MMLDLEWRNMRSKRWRGVVFAVVLAASATAQEPATDPSPEADDEALQGALASAESQTASDRVRVTQQRIRITGGGQLHAN